MLDNYLNKIQGGSETVEELNEKTLTILNKFFDLMGIRPKRKNQLESANKNFMKNYFKKS